MENFQITSPVSMPPRWPWRPWFQITQRKTGIILFEGHADDREHALDLMAENAGYADYASVPRASRSRDTLQTVELKSACDFADWAFAGWSGHSNSGREDTWTDALGYLQAALDGDREVKLAQDEDEDELRNEFLNHVANFFAKLVPDNND